MKKPPPKHRQKILQSYQHHLREVVGLSPKTCQNHSRDISHFLEAVPIRQAIELAKVTPANLTSYLTARSAGYQPASLRQVAGSLRQFLQFAQQQGWTSQSLSLAVPKIASRAQHALPNYLSPQQLDLLLDSWDRGTAQGQRDLAIGLCLARLGLRAGEVAALLLEDLDWRQGILRIDQSKNGNPAQLPLLAEVGESIATYLRAGRPACSYRQVFLFHQSVRAVSAEAISNLIRRALRRCGIEVPRPGVHLLRHYAARGIAATPRPCTCCSRGVDITAIALWLGHERPLTTHKYIEADLEMKKKTLNHLKAPKLTRTTYRPKEGLLAFLEAL